MCEHLVQGADLPRMHVGRTRGRAAQRRRLVGAHQLFARVRHEAQLRAFLRLGVAVGAEAIERVLLHQADAHRAAEVIEQAGPGGHAGVVEVVVRQQRAIVAVDALALANEHPESRDLVFREETRRGEVLRGDPGVEAGHGRQDRPLVGGDGLADVGEDPVDGFALVF